VAIPATLTMIVGNANADLKVTVNGIDSINNGTNYTSSAATNANGVLFGSYLTEEGGFTNARMVYIDDQSPTIAVPDFGQKYPVQATDDATNGLKSPAAALYPDNVAYSGNTSTRSDGATTANWLGHVEYKADNVITSGRAAVSGVWFMLGMRLASGTIRDFTAGRAFCAALVVVAAPGDAASTAIPEGRRRPSATRADWTLDGSGSSSSSGVTTCVLVSAAR